MRPASLAEVASQAAAGDSFDRCLSNFLDAFYAAPVSTSLAAEPSLLAPSFGESGHLQDAYLAATAEELARRFQFLRPSWTAGEARVLHKPWFATPLVSVRALLLLESPPSFRARNLFVSANALSRV
jgi:hypothetical protein